MSECAAKSLNKRVGKEEMSLYHMDQSDQSEIDLINGSFLANGRERLTQTLAPSLILKNTSQEGKVDVGHTVSSIGSKGSRDFRE